MDWKDAKANKPKFLVRVWVMTDAGQQTTGYLKRDGQWFLFCRKIAATNPTIVRWRQ